MKVTERKRTLNFANSLRLFAQDYAPNSHVESLVQKLATKIQNDYGESSRLKISKILVFMKNFESVSIRDVREHFVWRRQDIGPLIGEMLKAGQIEVYKQPTVVGLGPKGGRPATRYRLTAR